MALNVIEPTERDSPETTGTTLNTPKCFHVEIFGKHFDGKPVLGDICLALKPGSFNVITGPSGCGKSTLLKIIAGLDGAFNGFTANTPLRVGFAFQEPRLLPWRTVRENIALVCPDDQEVEALLEEMNLLEAAALYPSQISLGMARRASLARAIAVNPNLLLLDEPLVSLDEPTADLLRGQLLELWQRRRPTVLMVTHNLREALQLADWILVLGGSPTRLQTEYFYPHPRQERDRTWIDQELPLLEGQLIGSSN